MTTITGEPNVGLPLKAFTTKVPPGWAPGDPNYTLRQYEQLLRLWIKQTEVRQDQAGPMMAGRRIPPGASSGGMAMDLRIIANPGGSVRSA